MCGIAGIFGEPSESNAALVRAMTDSIRHRGPDDAGLEVLEEGRLVLGHRRLSILDLSPSGHQPMASADGLAWIVFNGEIYNFREIRRELEAAGCTFRSHSDTEVVLEAYRRWGLKCVDKFRGMFAFALWDAAQRQLHLCRDRFGVKPLYYCRGASGLVFASELRALSSTGVSSRRLDSWAAAHFFQFGYFSPGTSVFEDVRAVRPGTIVTFDASLAQREQVYWSVQALFQSGAGSELQRELEQLRDEALLDRLEESLTQAFEYRMVADVPVGVFLSGGIDSSTVATLLARAGVKLRTFTIGYAGSEFDETPYARAVAERLGAEHTELMLSGQDALAIVERLPEIADEPIGDSSLIPTFLVSRLAREHVTVALSADGADELFGGYARYHVCSRYLRNRTSLPWRALYALSAEAIERLPPALLAGAYAWTRGRGGAFAGINDKLRKFSRMLRSGGDRFSAYEAAVSEWTPTDVQKLLAAQHLPPPDAREDFESVSGLTPQEQFMYFDADRYLPGDLLTKVDRASMSVSLEARDPFLDHELAKMAAALPLRWKIREGKGKYALRCILGRYIPREIFDRPKKGFSAPVGEWLRGPLRELLMDELSSARVKTVGLLDDAAVRASLEDFFGQARRTSPAGLWFLLQVQQWAGRWAHAPSARTASNG